MAQSSHPVPSLPLKPSSRSWCPVIAPAADSSNLDKGKDTMVGDTIISDNNNTKQLYQQKQTTTTTTTVTKGITPTTTTVMPARTTKCQRPPGPVNLEKCGRKVAIGGEEADLRNVIHISMISIYIYP